MDATAERWDVFCRIVDHYGDAGVSWRLARQLAREQGKQVRLWMDDLTVLAHLRPEVDPARELQPLEGVQIARLREHFGPGDVADVVVETFGCETPAEYVASMAGRAPRTRWINLEYLSAEEWVDGCHALPSPHPRLPLTKHYFYPGFSPRTGGLLREESLLRRRDEFQADGGAQAAFWRSLVGRSPPEGCLKVSLFGYAGAPFEALARTCISMPGPIWLVVPEGMASQALSGWPNTIGPRANGLDGGHRRELEIHHVPFMPQDRYDQLLWACDVNFVRGEDSFVRAQWAARPFVWQIYPTDDGAHWVKLSAFLARYTAGLERTQAAAVVALWEAWNRGREPAEGPTVKPTLQSAWSDFIARREALQAHARDWAAGLASRRDLAASLADFVDNLL